MDRWQEGLSRGERERVELALMDWTLQVDKLLRPDFALRAERDAYLHAAHTLYAGPLQRYTTPLALVEAYEVGARVTLDALATAGYTLLPPLADGEGGGDLLTAPGDDFEPGWPSRVLHLPTINAVAFWRRAQQLILGPTPTA